jgi:hypothetical protein
MQYLGYIYIKNGFLNLNLNLIEHFSMNVDEPAFCHCDKYLRETVLKKERFISAHSYRGSGYGWLALFWA